jgi:hypothetical protein
MRQKVPENPEAVSKDRRSEEKAFAQLLVKALEKQQDRKPPAPQENASGTGTGLGDRYRFNSKKSTARIKKERTPGVCSYVML